MKGCLTVCPQLADTVSVVGVYRAEVGRWVTELQPLPPLIAVTKVLLTVTAIALVRGVFGVGGEKRPQGTRSSARPTAAPTIGGAARVIDGDTVVVAGTTVRLDGVDAAELGTARGEMLGG